MSKAVAKKEDAPAPAPVQEGDAIIMMIERAARDPNVDIEKMERLFLMRERMQAQQAKNAYLNALSDLQAEMPTIAKLGTINKNEKDERGNKTGAQTAMTKYAKWEDVVDAITPVLFAHGFSLSFRIAQPTADRLAVTAVLGHRAGHSEETTIALPIDSSGAKNNVQGWGSSTSYGKRYAAFALLNISARGEDDDGKAAGDAETIGQKQEEELQALIVGTNSQLDRFYAHWSKQFRVDITRLSEIPASRFEEVKTALEQKQKAQNGTKKS